MGSCYNSPRAKDVIIWFENRPVHRDGFRFYHFVQSVHRTNIGTRSGFYYSNEAESHG